MMLAQLLPIDWAGRCRQASPLCGTALCTRAGQWHIAWDIPYNGLLVPFEKAVGLYPGFPTYLIAAFVLPLIYGSWRFVVLHALFGPILASMLTTDPNEMPAVWCLFSIGIILVGLSPPARRRVAVETWWGRPVRVL